MKKAKKQGNKTDLENREFDAFPPLTVVLLNKRTEIRSCAAAAGSGDSLKFALELFFDKKPAT